jgi:transcriptional regulator with GAF, ATPase, and Fis domain
MNTRRRLGETALRLLRHDPSVVPASSSEERFGQLIGRSAEMRALHPLCARLAASEVPVVIEGETGTGKEVLAEALHAAGPRAGGPFVVFDCTAVPASLLEPALFGHERGAFTGALAQRRGVFEEAHRGTLLLDEIGELDLALQPRLLRAIERSEVQRVGGNGWLRVDVRILAATRRDLDAEVRAGRFRDDLFFRLAVGRIQLPPLRRRAGDIGVLANHFWRTLAGDGRPLPAGLLERLEDYAWPGNVRELKNAIARYVALGELPSACEGEPVSGEWPLTTAGDDAIERVLARDLPLPRARAEVVREFERRYLVRVLDRHGGNVSRAAAAAGIALRYFQLLRARRTK